MDSFLAEEEAEEEAEAKACSLVGVNAVVGALDGRELDMDVARCSGCLSGEVVRRSDATTDGRKELNLGARASPSARADAPDAASEARGRGARDGRARAPSRAHV